MQAQTWGVKTIPAPGQHDAHCTVLVRDSEDQEFPPDGSVVALAETPEQLRERLLHEMDMSAELDEPTSERVATIIWDALSQPSPAISHDAEVEAVEAIAEELVGCEELFNEEGERLEHHWPMVDRIAWALYRASRVGAEG